MTKITNMGRVDGCIFKCNPFIMVPLITLYITSIVIAVVYLIGKMRPGDWKKIFNEIKIMLEKEEAHG